MPLSSRLYNLVPLSGPPMDLNVNQIYVFGRSPECNIVVNDVQASRRHAELRFELDNFVLADLGSRNGTYVSGKRIRQKTLHNGDEIRIGSQTYRYVIRTEEQPIESLVKMSDKARMSETLASADLIQEQEDGGIMGSLGQFPPLELIQFLHSGQRSGVLEVMLAGEKAHFWFDAGNVVDAEMSGQAGEDAVTALAKTTAGFFSFQPSGAAKLRTPTISRPTPALLLDITSALDEQSA